MGHPPIENLLPRAGGSVYKLSRLASKRAAQLAAGSGPLVACDVKTKTATIALEEIAKGMVVLKGTPDEFVAHASESAPVSAETEKETEEIEG